MISETDDTITVEGVRARIRELTKGARVIRDRDGQVMYTTTSKADAEKWLADSDYDAAKFTIKDDAGSSGEGEALQVMLTKMTDSPDSAIWTAERVLNATWAQLRFRRVYGIASFINLTRDWPFGAVNWDLAARDYRDRLQSVQFGDTVFYAVPPA